MVFLNGFFDVKNWVQMNGRCWGFSYKRRDIYCEGLKEVICSFCSDSGQKWEGLLQDGLFFFFCKVEVIVICWK